ncbi:type IV secretion system protein TraC [Azospirillum sp. A23]|uniref:type IV secretion system protein TraC n=1 Tax=Azospirillum sp. A23 TaxID=3160608 RepID=UPI0036F2E289
MLNLLDGLQGTLTGVSMAQLREKLRNLFGDDHLIDRQSELERPHSIAELLPYRVYDQENDLYINRDSHGFILECSPLVGANEETVNLLTGMITDGLPAGCSGQILCWASPNVAATLKRWVGMREKQGGIYARLGQRRLEHLARGGWESLLPSSPCLLRHFRCFIALSLPGKGDMRTFDQMRMLRAGLVATLSGMKIRGSVLRPEGLIAWLDEVFNPREGLDRDVPPYSPTDPINAQVGMGESQLVVGRGGLGLGAVEECEDGRRRSAFDVRCFAVRSFPEVWAQWQMARLIGDPSNDQLRPSGPFLSVFTFTIGEDVNASMKASAKATRATQQAGTDMARFVPSIREKERDWKFAKAKLDQGQKLVKGFYSVVIFARRGEGDEAERRIRGLYRANGWALAREQFVQLQTFLTALPHTLSEGLAQDLDYYGRTRTMVSWTCANLAPLQGEWRGMGDPYLQLIGRRGEPFWWNPFANTEGNYNTIVVGKSGSGKSVAMQELAAALRGAGAHVVVVDNGRSFENSGKLQGGSHVEFTAAAGLCVNPFSIIDASSFLEDGDYRGEVVELINKMVRQMCRPHERTDSVENALIAKAIMAALEVRETGKLVTMTTVGHFLRENPDARAQDLGLMLEPYMVGGLYARLFEGECNIDLGNPLTIFEMAELSGKKELQGVVLLMLMFLVFQAMYRSKRRYPVALIIDEAWELLHGEASGEFIEKFARTCRKYFGALITGTQSVDDYYKTPATLAAFQNSDWALLLAQKNESVDAIKKSGRIACDPQMETALKSLKMVEHQYSEIMVYGPMGYHIGRLILDPYSIALYSSKGQDYAQIQHLVEQGVSLEDAVDKVADRIRNARH